MRVIISWEGWWWWWRLGKRGTESHSGGGRGGRELPASLNVWEEEADGMCHEWVLLVSDPPCSGFAKAREPQERPPMQKGNELHLESQPRSSTQSDELVSARRLQRDDRGRSLLPQRLLLLGALLSLELLQSCSGSYPPSPLLRFLRHHRLLVRSAPPLASSTASRGATLGSTSTLAEISAASRATAPRCATAALLR